MEKKMEHDTETWGIWGLKEVKIKVAIWGKTIRITIYTHYENSIYVSRQQLSLLKAQGTRMGPKL